MKQKSKCIITIVIIIFTLFSTSVYAIEPSNTEVKKITNNQLTIKMAETTQTTTTQESTQNAEINQTDTTDENELNLYADSCILVECSTGRTAYEKNSEEQKYPASITKVLTAIIAVENCNMDDVVTITREMTSEVPAGYTTAYLQQGEQLTVEQLLNALLIPSANDAGFALAIHISGSVEEFANLMNQRATELGCTNSHFTNPSGIHDEEHYSTAKDMSIIAMKAISYPQITNIVCKTSYVLEPSNSYKRTFETTNTLIQPDATTYYEYATGLKTGFTAPAGSCLIATAKKDNMQFIAVILDAPAPEGNIVYRDLDCKTLFDYGFENYEEITKVEEKPIIPIIQDHLSDKNKLSNIIKISGIILIILFILTLFKKRHHK